MAWIESHQNVKEHKKTYLLMSALGVSKRDALAIVHMVWWWCLDNALTGHIEVPPVALKAATEWERDADELVNGLLQSGWLERHPDAGFLVHDWYNYCGPLVEKRLQRKSFREKKAASVRRPKVDRAAGKSCPTVSVSESVSGTIPKEGKDKDTPAAKSAAVPAVRTLALRSPKPPPPNVEFCERFKALYQQMTGQPYDVKREHFVIAARLISAHGLEPVISKAHFLAVLCRDRTVWFTKGGWADFSIEKLSSRWNEIIPEVIPDKSRTEEQKILAELQRQKENHERANSLIR